MRHAVIVLAMLLGCVSRPPAGSPAPPSSDGAEVPIPVELREQVERSSEIGKYLYTLDKVAALGTDVLQANVGDLQTAGIVGYIPLQEGDENGPTGAFVVSFFTPDDPPRVRYAVRVERNAAPTFEAFDPPREGNEGLTVLVRARQLAIAAMPEIKQLVNPILLPGAALGEAGTIVYLLAGTKRHNVAVLGRHYRALIPPEGGRVSYIKPLTRAIVEIPTLDPFGKRVEGLAVSHVVTDYPLETHVFASLLYELPISVITSRGVWAVEGERITFFGKLQ
jgi:hypothetical protein